MYTGTPWIGVDLDRTLAEYTEFVSPTSIGKPVPKIQTIVLRLLLKGKKVKIFTARAAPDNPFREIAINAIQEWCLQHLGQVLEVTATKDFNMHFCIDDRAVAVDGETGKILGGNEEYLRIIGQ